MQIVAAGDNALLVELGQVTAAELHAYASAAREIAGVMAVIPGQTSVYVISDASLRGAVEDAVRRFDPQAPAMSEPRVHRVRVSFARECAADLAECLAAWRVDRDAFVARMATLRLRARYIGFRGGFAYLDGWPAEWPMPRRPTARQHVPRGTFAIAGTTAAFYPIDSPGGWNLIGRTDADLEHQLAAGDEIVLEPTGEPLAPSSVRPHRPRLELRQADVVAAPLVVPVGAADWSGITRGIPPGGPFDDVAAALAHDAVAGDVTLLECALAGPRLRFRRDAVVAWCGPDLSVKSQRVMAGDEFSIGRISGGLRGYLAIGDAERAVTRGHRDARDVIRAVRGPHDIGLERIECEVTPQLDRVGVRLRPVEPLDVDAPADLPSCGMQFGTIQLHPDGSIVAMGPDHPVTGGYLQPMTVLTSERWKLAQLTPGERVTIVAQLPSEPLVQRLPS